MPRKRPDYDLDFSVDVQVSWANGAGTALAEDAPGEWVKISGAGLSHPVLLRAYPGPDGRLACTGLLVGLGGHEVTSSGLRGVPLGAVLDWLRGLATGSEGAEVARILHWELPLAAEPLPRRSRRKPGNKPPTSEQLEQLERVYRRALAKDPRHAIKTTAEELRYSRATVHRWLARIRDAEGER